jgi:uncharacterized membrane protein
VESEVRTSSGQGPRANAPPADSIAQNIADMVELERREHAAASAAQKRLEAFSQTVARPRYLQALLVFVALWITANVLSPSLGIKPFDPPPFQWLQGLLTLIALMTTTVVLIAQTRQTRLSDQRSHLDLQINLLTEQKVTKLIHLLEELRSGLLTGESRTDPHVADLKKPTDAAQVVSALKDTGLMSRGGAGSSSNE